MIERIYIHDRDPEPQPPEPPPEPPKWDAPGDNWDEEKEDEKWDA